MDEGFEEGILVVAIFFDDTDRDVVHSSVRDLSITVASPLIVL